MDFVYFQIAILLFVLLLWAGAISLFYHQWGKIRGIDDYQPDYVHANMTVNPIPEETSDKIVSSLKKFNLKVYGVLRGHRGLFI